MRSNRDCHIIIHNDVLNIWKANNQYHDDSLFYAIHYLMKRFFISHRNAMTLFNSKFSHEITLPSHSTVHKRIEELSLVDTNNVDKYLVITPSKTVPKRYKYKIDASASQVINFNGEFKGGRISFKGIDKGFLIKKERQINVNKSKGTLSTHPSEITKQCLITNWFTENKYFIKTFYSLLKPESYSHYFDLLLPLFKNIKGAKSLKTDNQEQIVKDTLGKALTSKSPDNVPIAVKLLPFEIIHTDKPSKQKEHRLSLILWINCGHSGKNFIRFLPLGEYEIVELAEITYSINMVKNSEYINISLTVESEVFQFKIPYKKTSIKHKIQPKSLPKEWPFTPVNTKNFAEDFDELEIKESKIDQPILSISTLNKENDWQPQLSKWVTHLNLNADCTKADRVFFAAEHNKNHFIDCLSISAESEE
jgi:hypothetical protein